MKLKILGHMVLLFWFSMNHAQEVIFPERGFSESINPIQSDVKYWFNILEEKPWNAITIFTFSENEYSFGLFKSEYKSLNMGIHLRVEDELPYESRNYIYSGFYYFDINLNYNLGAFNFSFLLENLLGLNNRDVSITPEVFKQQGVYNEIVFVYDSAFLLSAGISYNF